MRALILAAALAAPAAAQNTGASFLRIDSGARPAALGGAYTASADDVHALRYNPSGMARLGKRELGMTHSEWLLGSRYDFVGYAQPLAAGFALGVGLGRLTSGSIESRAADRSAAGSFDVAHTVYSIGAARRLPVGTGAAQVGANVKFIESRIGGDSARSAAVDLGAGHQLSALPLSLGFAVTNIGKGIRFLDQTDPLPLAVSAGAAYRFLGFATLAMDVRRDVHDRRTEVSVGTEYSLMSAVAVRAGYGSQQSRLAGQGGLAGFGGGLGVRVSRYQVDYNFTPFGALGNVQRISVGARF